MKSAFAIHQHILLSPSFHLSQRLLLYKSLIMVHAVQSTHTISHIPTRELKTLSHTYTTQLKRVAAVGLNYVPGANTPPSLPFHHVPDTDFLLAIGQPSLPNILSSRVLGFLSRLATKDHPFVRGTLSLSHPNGMIPRFLASLNLLRNLVPPDDSLAQLPVASLECFHIWLQAIILHQSWKSLLKRSFTASSPPNLAALRLLATIHIDIPPPPPLLEPPIATFFTCDICHRQFASERGYYNHRRQSHDIFPPLCLRVTTTHCTACGSQLGTRNKVLKHLRERSFCAMHILHTVPPMSLTTYKNSIHQLNSLDTTFTRSTIPKRGRIGPSNISQS
eukprot:3558653-Amphidinium_carterae.5